MYQPNISSGHSPAVKRHSWRARGTGQAIQPLRTIHGTTTTALGSAGDAPAPMARWGTASGGQHEPVANSHQMNLGRAQEGGKKEAVALKLPVTTRHLLTDSPRGNLWVGGTTTAPSYGSRLSPRDSASASRHAEKWGFNPLKAERRSFKPLRSKSNTFQGGEEW